MSFDSNRSAIAKYIDTNWPGPWKIIAENVPPPADRSKAWVRYSLRPATTTAWDISATMERTNGFLWFQAFLPEDTGPNEAYKISDAIRKICFEKRITDALGVLIQLRAAELSYIGTDPTGEQVWRCIVPYQADADPITQ